MDWFDKTGRLADPTGDEFKDWVSAKDAFGHLLMGVDRSLSDALVHRLKTGMLFGAATTAKWEGEGGRKLTKYVTSIDPAWWGNVDGGRQEHYDRLWKHGDITLVIPNRGENTNTTVHFFDVRFEWSGLHDIVPKPWRLAPLDRPAPEFPGSTPSPAPAEPASRPGEESSLTPEEYSRWVHPPHALAMLSEVADLETLVMDIASHLEDGLIRAVAETMTVTGGGSQQWNYCRINPKYWIGWACLAEAGFWKTGNREVFSDSVPCRRHDLAPVRMYRVRFNPEDLAKLLPPPLPVPRGVDALVQVLRNPKPATSLVAPPERPVTNAQIDDWYASLSAADQARSVRWLTQEAKRALGASVVRKQLEPFGKGRGPGRKPGR